MSRYIGTRKSNMTTVINLHILNVYNLRQNTYRAMNLRLKDGDESQSTYSRAAKEKIIDITPEFRALNSGIHNRPEKKGCPAYRENNIVNKRNEGIYDRTGRSVQYCQTKGMHVDSYA